MLFTFAIPEMKKDDFRKLQGKVVAKSYVTEYERGYIEGVKIEFESGEFIEFRTDGSLHYSLEEKPT